jgi:hypothetical protein
MIIAANEVVFQLNVDSKSFDAAARNSLAVVGFGGAIILSLLSYVHYSVIVLEGMCLKECLQKKGLGDKDRLERIT